MVISLGELPKKIQVLIARIFQVMRDAYTHIFMRKKHWMKKPLGASLTDVSERLRPERMDKQTNEQTNKHGSMKQKNIYALISIQLVRYRPYIT